MGGVCHDVRDRPHRGRLADWLAFCLPFAVAVAAGWLAHGRALVDLDTLAAAQKAWEALHLQAHANLALIGFEQPPLLALLYLPLSAFAPGLLVSGLAGPLLGACFLGLSVLVLCRLSRALGLPGWLTCLIAAGFALHPLVLSYATLGARAIVLTFVLLGLSASLIHWGRTERVRDLVTGGLFAAAAILLAYETLAVVIAAAAYIAWRCRPAPGTAPAKAEGTLIAFLLPAAYVALVWVITDWAIMGQPLHFWQVTTTRAILLGRDTVHDWLQPLLTVLVIANPLLLALIYGHLRRASRPATGLPAAGMLVAALVSPVLFISLRPVPTDGSPWGALMPLAATGLGVGVALLVAFASDVCLAGSDWRRVVSPGLALVAIGSVGLAAISQLGGQGLPVGLRSALSGRPAFAAYVGEEWRAGEAWAFELAGNANGGIIAGPLGYVVALRARAIPPPFSVFEVVDDARVPPGPRASRLSEGMLLALDDPQGTHAAEWWAALPHYLHLKRLWAEGKWVCYEVTEHPEHQEPTFGRHDFPRGAIIRP
jgi:hypothetical protein